MALCRMNNPNNREDNEHQRENPKDCGNRQYNHRADIQEHIGQYTRQHAAYHGDEKQHQTLVCVIPCKGILLCSEDRNQN